MHALAAAQLLGALLVDQLGHTNYYHRECAYRALKDLVWIAPSQVERATKHHDFEIAHRAARIYRPVFEKRIEQTAFSLCGKWPWLYLDDSTELWYHINSARDLFRLDSTQESRWFEYRMGTKHWVWHQMLYNRKSVNWIKSELHRMQVVEDDCRKQEWLRCFGLER